MDQTVSVRNVSGVVVAAFPDEVDIANVRDVRMVVLESLTAITRGLVLDLTNTAYFDSKGIHLLIELDQLLKKSRQGFRLAARPGSPVARLLELTGLRIPLAATVDDALTSMRQAAAADGGGGPDVQPEAS